MRIRTDGNHSHREDTINQVTEFYERNRTDSLLRAAEDVPKLVQGILQVLQREDLTHAQRRELADTLSTRHFDFSFAIENGEIVAIVNPE